MFMNLDRSFYRFVTIHACDRQTDRRTDGRTDGRTDRILITIPRLHYMQRGKNLNASSDGQNYCSISGNRVAKANVDSDVTRRSFCACAWKCGPKCWHWPMPADRQNISTLWEFGIAESSCVRNLSGSAELTLSALVQ